jgi:hypothetical protein
MREQKHIADSGHELVRALSFIRTTDLHGVESRPPATDAVELPGTPPVPVR